MSWQDDSGYKKLTAKEFEKKERHKKGELKRKQFRVLFTMISTCIMMLGLLIMVMPLPVFWLVWGFILFCVGGISTLIIGADVALFYEEKYSNIW